jgi:hypothetical protein
MTDLVACLSTGKGTWTDVLKIVDSENWEKIFIITNEFGIKNFSCTKKVNFVIIDDAKLTKEITNDIVKQMQGKIDGFEIALNILSGTGKEHTAILSALLKLGLAVRFVSFEENKVIDL